MNIHALLVLISLVALSPVASADTASAASTHFNAIAAAEVGAIMSDYANGATFQWVGGPLDGSYQGSEAIHGVWTKFTRANGPLKLEISKLETSANPKGETVTANVIFQGKNTIKVRYALTYRDGKIVNEIWQIDPKMMAAYQD